MKKFRFGLDSVLDYRRQVLDGCQGEYAQALDQVRRQEARKAEAEDRYRQLTGGIPGTRPLRVSPRRTL